MLKTLIVVAAAACAAAPALAQTPAAASTAPPGSLVGTWGFQSEDYGNDEYALAMSGVAVITQAQGARYNIRLLAQQQLTDRESGETHMLVAQEACTGESLNGQLTIRCQLANPLQQNYQPDAFVLQQGDNGDQLVGTLTSQSDGQTTFNRVR
jgi:hypothetical protein